MKSPLALCLLLIFTALVAAPVPMPPSIVSTDTTIQLLVPTFTSSTPVKYQWYKANKPIPGATGTSLVVPNSAASATYFVEIRNASGSARSGTVSLATTRQAGAATITITEKKDR